MFPDFQYLLQSLTEHEMPEWLSIFKTFGFLVALSFVGAAWATSQELKRKEKLGLLSPEITTMVVGQKLTWSDLTVSAIVGFILGAKLSYLFVNLHEVSTDPMGFFISFKGNIIFGIIGAVIAGGIKYLEVSKQALPEPKTITVKVYPHELMTEVVVVAAVGGLAGAKLFNALETWDDFIKHPIQSLTSSSGLTFLGGLIVATIAFYYYTRRHGIPFKHMCDAAAPGIMLGYGLGRLGCQLSGDGDWGIFNTAFVTQPDNSLRAVSPQEGLSALQQYEQTFRLPPQPYTYCAARSGLPNWLFGMNFPHNVGHEGVVINGCTGEYCTVLPIGVFPTPIYEAIACIILYFVLWSLRKRFTRTLQMFGTYLIFVGIERFLVEQIRVNYKYDWGFIHPTQAEILSVVLVLMGLGLLLFYKDKQPIPAPPPTEPTT